jgi:anti-sigma factor RsiW
MSMMDQWTDRLSEYLDGDLPSAEQAELEQHVESCFECRRVLGELREVVARASALSDSEPANDLWSGIAARLSEKPLQLADMTVIGTRDSSVSRPSSLRSRPARRVTFSLPQLAAAAIVLMVLSGGLVWAMIGQRATPAAVAVVPTNVRTVSNTPAPLQQYASAVDQLESVLRENRDKLDPVTVAILEENLKSIDAAITEARVALERDPGNLYLNQHLEATMKKKIQLLRRANSIGGSAI